MIFSIPHCSCLGADLPMTTLARKVSNRFLTLLLTTSERLNNSAVSQEI